MIKKIQIRNLKMPKKPRVFDVTVDDEDGKILRYDMQNIKGPLYVDDEDVQAQIKEAIAIN